MRRALVVLVLLVAGACGSDNPAAPDDPQAPTTSTTPPTTAEASGATSPQPRGAVPEALDFTAAAVTGDRIDARTFAGADVALWFWAPW